MVEIKLQLPESMVRILGDTPESVSQRILENVAITEYRAGRLSHRQVGEVLGLDYWSTEQLFVSRRVPIDYTIADLEADRVTLRRVLGKR